MQYIIIAAYNKGKQSPLIGQVVTQDTWEEAMETAVEIALEQSVVPEHEIRCELENDGDFAEPGGDFVVAITQPEEDDYRPKITPTKRRECYISFTAQGHVKQRVEILDDTITPENIQAWLKSGTAVTTIQERGDVVIFSPTGGNVIARVLDVDNHLEYDDFEVSSDTD